MYEKNCDGRSIELAPVSYVTVGDKRATFYYIPTKGGQGLLYREYNSTNRDIVRRLLHNLTLHITKNRSLTRAYNKTPMIYTCPLRNDMKTLLDRYNGNKYKLRDLNKIYISIEKTRLTIIRTLSLIILINSRINRRRNGTRINTIKISTRRLMTKRKTRLSLLTIRNMN